MNQENGIGFSGAQVVRILVASAIKYRRLANLEPLLSDRMWWFAECYQRDLAKAKEFALALKRAGL